MFFDILYNITIYPIEFIIEILFYLFNNVFRSSYGVSLFLLSLSINFLSLPLYNIAESWQAKERAVQDKMKPMIDNIKAVYKGDQRYLLIRACQRINGYKTIYAFRGTLGLLIQIPFFMAAYNFVHSLTGLNGVSFLFINDLSKPDALIHIGNISINLLPFLMTLFSLLAGFVYSKKLKFKESLPLYIVSLIFLILLYNSPSGLLFYWTINCLFSLIKNIIIEFKLYEIFLKNKYKLLKVYNIFSIVVISLFILLVFLSNIERKGYLSDLRYSFKNNDVYVYEATVRYYSKIFVSSDLFGIKINTNVFPSQYIEDILYIENTINTKYINVALNKKLEDINDKIDIYYKLYLKDYAINIFITIVILFILFNMNKIFSFIFNNKIVLDIYLKNRYKLILINCFVITILSGVFIPTSLIGASPQEFTNPFYLILNNFTMNIGLFLFYPMFIYLLFSEKIKNYITLFSIFIAILFLIDTFIMTGNYVNINSDFVFDNTNLLKASFKEICITIILFVSAALILILFFKKNININILINIYSVIIITLFGISIFNTVKIFKEHAKLIGMSDYDDNIKIFDLSKKGQNVFVLVLDKALGLLWLDAFERFPEYKEKLDGFVFFQNNLSFGANTATIASLYGGYEYLPYELSTNGNYNIKDKHNEALLMIPMSLAKYGYKSSILEPTYANFEYVPDLSVFKNYTNISAYNNNKILDYSYQNYFGNTNVNISKYNLNSQKNKMIRFSIFRMIPINFRYNFYDDSGWFMYSTMNLNNSISSYAIFSNLKHFININDNENNYYNVFYNLITHEPHYFNSDCMPDYKAKDIDEKDLELYKDQARFFYANVSALKELGNFIEFLKENQVYDNTKIILVSDHGVAISSTMLYNNLESIWTISPFNALLMFKDFNTRGELKINTNFSTIADMPYLATKHITNIRNYFTDNLITANNKNFAYAIETRGFLQYTNKYSFDTFFLIKDNILDINNWKKFQIDWKTKESKEIELK